MTNQTFSLPPLAILLRGLGIRSIPEWANEVTVDAAFLRYILAQFAALADFNTEFYKSSYPDAQADVEAGKFPSLREHFLSRGFLKGYLPAPLRFDATWYLANNVGLAEMHARYGNAGLQKHFLDAGYAEGRSASAGDVGNKEWAIKAENSSQLRRHVGLATMTFDDAKVQVRPGRLPGGGIPCGPVLGLSPLENALRHKRYNRTADAFDDEARYDKFLHGQWNYLGLKFYHFGHAMAETIHRILPSQLQFKSKNWVYIDPNSDAFRSLKEPRYFMQVLEFFGIQPDNVQLVGQNTIVERLNIAEQGACLGGVPDEAYLTDLASFSSSRLTELAPPAMNAPMIYVSRSKLPPGGNYLGEKFLEQVLASVGFEIFYPEEHSLLTQMEVYRQAQVVIFGEGSACHGVELLGYRMLRTCILIPRRHSHHNTFRNILRPRSINFAMFPDFIDLGTAVKSSSSGNVLHNLSVSVLDLRSLVDFLNKEVNLSLSYANPNHYRESIDRDLNAYLSHYVNEPEVADQGLINEVLKRYKNIAW